MAVLGAIAILQFRYIDTSIKILQFRYINVSTIKILQFRYIKVSTMKIPQFRYINTNIKILKWYKTCYLDGGGQAPDFFSQLVDGLLQFGHSVTIRVANAA